jgi:hypothetical protein
MDERVLTRHLVREQREVDGRDKIVGASFNLQM